MSIPRTLFICPHGPRRPLDIYQEHGNIHSWPQWANVLPDCWVSWGNYITPENADQIADRELVIINGGARALHVFDQVKRALPHAMIAGLQDANTAWEGSNEAAGRPVSSVGSLVEFYSIVDCVFTATRNARSFYELLGNNRVRYIGLPYPMEWCKVALPEEAREPTTLLVGGQHRAGRGVMLGIMVAAEMRYKALVMGDPAGEVKALCEMFGVESERFPQLDQTVWLHAVRKARVALYLDQMGSVGRFPRDCAALKIPCITSGRSDFGSRIGEMGVEPSPVWRVSDPDYHAGEIVRRALAAGSEWWNKLTRMQRAELAEFDTPHSLARFEAALDWL